MSALVTRLAVGTLAYTLGVILLGAYVRASGSGAGCGRSWPTCQGEILPIDAQGAQAVEFAHRATSGLTGVIIIALVILAMRNFPAGHPTRKAAYWSLFFVVTEGLFGAALVRNELVADDASVARAIIVPLHLVNTLLLVAALVMTVWFAGGGRPPAVNRDRRFFRLVLIGAAAMIVLSATGAVAALADTLFPSESLTGGLAEDFDRTSSFLTRLRVAHPIVAIAVGAYVAWLGLRRGGTSRAGQRAATVLLWLVGVQMAAGLVNVLLLTPIWMQLVHLFLADLLWITLIWFGLIRLGEPLPALDESAAAAGVTE